MASMIASKRATAAKLLLPSLQKLLYPVTASSTIRGLNTSAMSDVDEDRSLDIDRRSNQDAVSRRRDSSSGLLGDVFDPFFPSRSLSQVLNLMDQFMENPLLAASRGMGGGMRRGWEAKEDTDALYLRMDMPGLGKEHVKVSAEQNTLIIRGEGEPESEDEESRRRFSSRIDLPPKVYKIDQIRAEMKNGVLKVIVPKVKEDERKDVFLVNIE